MYFFCKKSLYFLRTHNVYSIRENTFRERDYLTLRRKDTSPFLQEGLREILPGGSPLITFPNPPFTKKKGGEHYRLRNILIHLMQDEKHLLPSTMLRPHISGWYNPRPAMNGVAILTKPDQSGRLGRGPVSAGLVNLAPCFNTGWNRWGQRIIGDRGERVPCVR